MANYTCTGKVRDRNNVITHYKLSGNGREIVVNKDTLKAKILANEVKVNNLKMDTQGRLLDCTPQEIENNNRESAQDNRESMQQQRMSDEELKRMIELLSNETKGRDTQIMRVLRELYARNNDLLEKVEELSNIADNNVSNKLDDILGKLVSSEQDMDTLKSNIENLARNIEELSNNDKREYKSIVSSDGKIEEPDTDYEKALLSNFFHFNDNGISLASNQEELKDAIKEFADETKSGFRDAEVFGEDIPYDMYEKLKEEIEKKSIAFYKTKDYFMDELTDRKEALNTSALFSAIGIVSEGVGKVATFADAGVDMTLAVTRSLPGLERKSDESIYKRKYKSKGEVSFHEQLRLTDTAECIWSNYNRTLVKDDDLDIKVYCIQSLSKLYLGAWQNNIQEKVLLGLFKEYRDKAHNIKLKIQEVEEKVYEYTVISYFAAKSVASKEFGSVPFSKNSLPNINGKCLSLTRVAMAMTGMTSCCIEYRMREFLESAKDIKLIVNKDVKLTDGRVTS